MMVALLREEATMLTNVATVLAGLIGVGIIFVGARAFWAPQAAVGFGIPAHRPRTAASRHGWPSRPCAT